MNFAEIWEAISDAGITAGNQVQKNAKKLSKYDKEDILAAVGLEPKRGAMDVIVPAVGFFAVGILAGVGLGLLFAPKPGYELREDLTEQFNNKIAAAKKDAADATAGTITNDMSPVI